MREPQFNEKDELCIMVMLSAGGRLLPHSVDHAIAWHKAGFKVLAAVIVQNVFEPISLDSLDFAVGIVLRKNSGYDFGAWATVVHDLGPTLNQLNVLILANDSVLGPSLRFGDMCNLIRSSSADLIGLVRSEEKIPHLQSFMIAFKNRAINSVIFSRFWNSVRTNDRQLVINKYEVKLTSVFENAGFVVDALYGDGFNINPTLYHWRILLNRGLPFIKVQLLRDNPCNVNLSNWRCAALAAGFALDRIDFQITELKTAYGAEWRSI